MPKSPASGAFLTLVFAENSEHMWNKYKGDQK